jgi:hypothetical protein
VVFEIVSIVEESLSVLALSASMSDLLPHALTRARGVPAPAPAASHTEMSHTEMSHTEMVCVALLRCLELTVACINQREPWPSSTSAPSMAATPAQSLVSLAELLSILEPDRCRSSSPIQPSPRIPFKDILSQSQPEDAPTPSEVNIQDDDAADAKDPALASWVSIVQRALAASSCLVTDACPGVRNQAISTAVHNAALLFRIDSGVFAAQVCCFFITPLCRSNLHSDKGRPALVQLWPPLSRRLVDADAFARASALAALKAASRVDAPFFTKKVMEQVWPVLSARACGGDAGASHTMHLLYVCRLMLTMCAEALAGVADIVRSFPQSTVLPDFACALALWCESRCKRCSAPVLVHIFT